MSAMSQLASQSDREHYHEHQEAVDWTYREEDSAAWYGEPEADFYVQLEKL